VNVLLDICERHIVVILLMKHLFPHPTQDRKGTNVSQRRRLHEANICPFQLVITIEISRCLLSSSWPGESAAGESVGEECISYLFFVIGG
jgi:hypothetical protein